MKKDLSLPTQEQLEAMPRSFSEARSLGVRKYYTGRPCLRGHVADRLTSTQQCCECDRERYRRKSHEEYTRQLEINRQWYANNRERHIANTTRWSKDNLDKTRKAWRECTRRRRAQKLRSPDSFTESQFDALKARYQFRCLACGRHESELKNPLQPDHIVPLSRGGMDGIDNIQPLCKPCNQHKLARTIDYRPDREVAYENVG